MCPGHTGVRPGTSTLDSSANNLPRFSTSAMSAARTVSEWGSGPVPGLVPAPLHAERC